MSISRQKKPWPAALFVFLGELILNHACRLHYLLPFQSIRPRLTRVNLLILYVNNRSDNAEYKYQRVWLLYALKNKISTDNRKALFKPASTGILEKQRPTVISMQQLGNH